MSVINISDDQFHDVISKNAVVLVDFWAPWCGPCRQIAPILDEVAKNYEGRALVVKINVDESTNVAAEHGVRSIPTLMLFKNGTLAQTLVGAQSKTALSQLIDSHL